MAIKFDKIRAGDTLLDIHREKAGNTTMSRWGCWKVRVISVDSANETAMVSWNGNAPSMRTRRQLEKLYAKEPGFYTKWLASATGRMLG